MVKMFPRDLYLKKKTKNKKTSQVKTGQCSDQNPITPKASN